MIECRDQANQLAFLKDENLKIEDYYRLIPDVSFSDRLCGGDLAEILRTDA